MTERQTGSAPWASKEPGGGDRGREGRGWGRGHHRWGRTADGGTDTLPRSPGASPRLSFSAQLPPWGPRSWEFPARCWGGLGWAGGTWGRKGARLDCAQLQGKSSVSRACPVCVVGGWSHTPTAPFPRQPLHPPLTSTGVTPASEAQGKMAAQAAPPPGSVSLAPQEPLTRALLSGGAVFGFLPSASSRAWYTGGAQRNVWGPCSVVWLPSPL